MANYHLHAKIIKRSDGVSGVAAAAYRSCSRIKDERRDITFDYTKKQDLAFSQIMGPENTPKWMFDRAKLWNHIELLENRINSQIAREIEISLPVELTLDQNIECVREFVQENFVRRGMIADVNLHNKRDNPHVHIMLTMRRIKGNGFGDKKDARAWNNKSLLLRWRQEWANTHNRHMAMAGYDIRIDHRSYEEQGIKILPQIKLGISTYKDHEFDRINIYKKILYKNGKQIIADPKSALDHLTSKQSTFTQDDILKYVHAHSDESQFYKAVEAVMSCSELVLVQENDYERFNRYTSKSMIETEQALHADLADLGKRRTHIVKEKYIRQALGNTELSQEQEIVLRETVNGNNAHVIIGHAGTGKSFTLTPLRETYEALGYDVQGIALAGVAARGLEGSSGINSTTIARKLLLWENGKDRLTERSVLIIDEAGMVGTRLMQSIIAEVKKAGAKLIAVGDRKQTQAIEAGDPLRAMTYHCGVSRLDEIWRQKEQWQKDATRLLSGDEQLVGKAIDAYHAHGRVHELSNLTEAISAMVSDYVRNYSTDPDNTSLMMAFQNADVDRLNQLCRHRLKTQTTLLGEKEFELATENGVKLFAAGDRIFFTKPERSIGVENGSFGTVAKIKANGVMRVDLDSGSTVVIDVGSYSHFTHGYAATVHKLQGATISRSHVLACQSMDRHLGYVAMSRHKHRVDLYWSKDQFQNLEHVKRTLSNLGVKELISDYEQQQGAVEKALAALTAGNATFNEKRVRDTAQNLRLDHGEQARQIFLENIQAVGADHEGRLKYSTIGMIKTESEMFAMVDALTLRSSHYLHCQETLDLLGGIKDEEQKLAVKRIVQGTDLCIIHHQSGVDRSNAAGLIARAFAGQGYVVEAAALSNAGARRFEQKSGVPCATLHKKLWEWENGKNLLNNKTLLFVDSANRIGTRLAHQILEQAQKAGAKVVLLGNIQMPQAHEAGDAWRGILQRSVGTKVALNRSGHKLFKWEDKAFELLNGDSRQVARALDLYIENDRVVRTSAPIQAMVSDWAARIQRFNVFEANLMMAYRNKDVAELNLAARQALRNNGLLGAAQASVKTYDAGTLNIGEGERLLFTRKDKNLGVNPGALGTVQKIEGGSLSVKLDSGSRVQVDTRLYNDLRYGYAVTVHRGADMTAGQTYILANRNFNRHVTLAALQAHTVSTKLYHSFENMEQFKACLCRPGEKDLVVDYPMPLDPSIKEGRQARLKRDVQHFATHEARRPIQTYYSAQEALDRQDQVDKEKPMAEDRPAPERSYYRVTVELPDGRVYAETFDYNERAGRDDKRAVLEKTARDFLHRTVIRAHVKADEINQIKTTVNVATPEQIQALERTKDKSLEKDRGPGLGF